MKSITSGLCLLGTGIIIGFCAREIVFPGGKNAPGRAAAAQPIAEFACPATVPERRLDRAPAREANRGTATADAPFSLAEMRAALDHLKDIPDLAERANALQKLIRRWAEQDGRGAFGYVQALEEGETKVKLMGIVAAALANADPQFLAAQTLTLPNTRSSRELVQDLAKNWAVNDAPGALIWAEQLPDSFGKGDALAIVLGQLGKQNPEQVSSLINQLPAGDFKNSLISNLASEWGLNSPGEAIAWANTLPDTEKGAALSNLIGAWAQQDPSAAGSYVAQMPAGDLQNQVVLSAVLGWAGTDPAGAGAWVLQFPDGLRDQGLHSLMGAWVTADSSGALNWASGLADDATRNAALENFVESAAYWSPARAASAALLISDPAQQEEAMKTAMSQWAQIDPEAAQNWLDQASVTSGAKTELQSVLSASN